VISTRGPVICGVTGGICSTLASYEAYLLINEIMLCKPQRFYFVLLITSFFIQNCSRRFASPSTPPHASRTRRAAERVQHDRNCQVLRPHMHMLLALSTLTYLFADTSRLSLICSTTALYISHSRFTELPRISPSFLYVYTYTVKFQLHTTSVDVYASLPSYLYTPSQPPSRAGR
jgi:hypothetical protein